ncbi:MAG TPA: Maf family nucleotide pyrophosphatase [Casimicrobiaceae bacterium]|jgi:septum formation protein|nr:Maf family nucleotide pyrophosphatase [Casimicrobiaceae bacterium]
MENPPLLVLASTSVYRRDLLARLGVPFETARPDVDETPLAGETPAATARRLAQAKARNVAARYPRGALVIGADQVADLDGLAVSKPLSHANAVEQLTRASGRSVVFHTAVALVDAPSGRCRERLIDVTTKFRTLTPTAIEHYLRHERPYDCAGAVKAEALGIAIVESIRSDDPTALIGLPLISVVDLLRAEGVDVLAKGC